MGKLYKKMEQPEEAILNLTTALDLDSKSDNLIKAALDKVHIPDIEEDDRFELST